MAGSKDEKLIDAWLRENLTVVQYQKFKQFMEGMAIREIARAEGINYSSASFAITYGFVLYDLKKSVQFIIADPIHAKVYSTCQRFCVFMN